MGRQAPAIASIRLHRPHHLRWHHGPRGGEEKARRRQDHRVLLLEHDIWHGAEKFACLSDDYGELHSRDAHVYLMPSLAVDSRVYRKRILIDKYASLLPASLSRCIVSRLPFSIGRGGERKSQQIPCIEKCTKFGRPFRKSRISSVRLIDEGSSQAGEGSRPRLRIRTGTEVIYTPSEGSFSSSLCHLRSDERQFCPYAVDNGQHALRTSMP